MHKILLGIWNKIQSPLWETGSLLSAGQIHPIAIARSAWHPWWAWVIAWVFVPVVNRATRKSPRLWG